MRYSYQRECILTILRNSTHHYPVEKLHKSLEEFIPNVSLMTVYRNASLLAKKGYIISLHVDNAVHYCGNSKPHNHLHCLDCGKIIDYYDTDIEKKIGPTLILSGDDIRKMFNLNSYSHNDRKKYVKMYHKICKNIVNQNINIIFAVVGLFDFIRKQNSGFRLF